MKKIIAVHLYNDYSGSPLVLSTVIKGFVQNNLPVVLYTAKQGEGFLSDLPVKYAHFTYVFFDNKILRLLMFAVSQLFLFIKLLRYRKEEVVIYVNTLLPFGAAIAGKMMGKKVVYHVHETSIKPLILKRFLKFVAAKTASEVVYVSQFLASTETLNGPNSKVVHNALSKQFVLDADRYQKQAKEKNKMAKVVQQPNGMYLEIDTNDDEMFTVLMLCSLKDYKGVKEFVNLAKRLPQLRFELVLNVEAKQIGPYFEATKLPMNLFIFPKQSNVHTFYQKANLVLNLSHPKQWVETFGMTLLEAMYYGLPVIAPPVGGPTEIVTHGFNGYAIDQRNEAEMVNAINELANTPLLYKRLSENAKSTAQKFSVLAMQEAIVQTVK